MNLPFHIDLSRAAPRPPGPDPERDWLIVLSLALAFLAASALGNAFLYREAVIGAPIGGGNGAGSAALSADALAKVESVFAARAAESAKYENGAYSFVDPSRE
ncbi:MAG TPA: hypothetical protein VHC68_02475 [Candidatus Paceibacterota bacterium]|nr:hypothetical protein [Candidatus Paceibacterota bacterium]